ncbi:Acyltransferase, partial [Oryctes borbonicus]
WKWPKRGLIGLCTLAIVSTGMRYHSTYIRNLANYVYYGASSEQLFLTADYMYIIPAYRLTVYVMGIILGYLLREHKDIRLKQIYIHIGNVIALLSFIGAFLAPSFMGSYDYEYDPVEAAWYAAYAPILWCLCFAWIIYITHIGHKGYMAPILRNPIPKMWSKISYTVYLTQFPVYFYNVGTTKHSDEFDVIRKHLNFLELFWIIACSVLLTLLIELPSQNIRDWIFKKPKPPHNQIQKEK